LRYLFEDYALDTDCRELHRRGELVALEPQVFDLLSYLIRHRNCVVSKDDLIAAIWNNRIVSESVINTRINAARTALGDSGDAQRLIRTLRGRGIRFVGTVEESQFASTAGGNEPRLVLPADAGEQQLKNIARPVRAYRVQASKTIAEARSALSLPSKPSIAVLPFTNMSGDPEQEYFADGMVDEIITALSRFRWLFVIARSSTFIYKGQAVDVKRVSRDLGVRYVLEGSLRKGGGRVRVTAQLIDALSAAHLWADRYDRDLTDVFAVQDEITASVAAVIEPALTEAERQRVLRKPPASLDAWETYQRGLWHCYKFSADENEIAQTYFRRAIATHPDFAPGHYGLALAQQLHFWLYSPHSSTGIAGLAVAEARIGVSLDGKDSMAHAILCYVQQLCGEWEPAIAEGRTAINLNPNSVWSMMALGVALGFGGYPREGVDHLRQAMRASPHDPMTRFWTFWIGVFQYHLRDYEATVVSMREVIRLGSALDGYAARWTAQALGQLGRVAEAKAELERAIAISPVQFDRYVRQRALWHRPEDYALAIEGLRKAGWAG